MAEKKPPVWLDLALVQEALRRGGDDDIVVKSITIRPAGKVGDNYGSVMYRITAETDRGAKSVICKTSPSIAALQDCVKEANVFVQEAFMLSEVIPKIHKLLDEAAPGRFSPIAAGCPHHGQDPDDFLFIEDLAPQGFVLADRVRGLGLRHTLLAVRTLARYHAASAILLAQDPSLEKKLVNLYTFANKDIENFFLLQIQMVVDACRNWPDFPTEVTDALETAKDSAYQKYAQAMEPLPGRFNVIIHGDFWINNMMFRYEDNDVKDIRLVDFQTSHVASPTVDLIYFLSGSVSEDVSTNHLDLVLREYHVALKEAMTLLGLRAPSLEDLLEDINTNSFIHIVMTCMVPTLKSETVPDLEAAFSGERVNDFTLKVPVVQRWLKRVFPEYYRKGWLK